MVTWFERAEQLRHENHFDAAIDAYNKAINLCPNNPVYFTNRAACHSKLNDWAEAVDDSRRAIELDNTSAEAHYILGSALLEKNEYVEAVRELEKAFDLETGANPNGDTAEDIRQLLLKAKFYKWENAYNPRSWELRFLQEACVCALNEKHSRDVSQMAGPIEAAKAQHLQRLNALERIFSEAAETDMPTEVPDHLRCPINHKMFRDPVITPSGHTYEREEILHHLENNNFDPMTQQPLNSSQLVPNLAIKEAVRVFSDKHAWAYGLWNE